MRLKFLGGVNEVGRLGMVMEVAGNSYLFDYGIAPSDPPQYPDPAPDVDMAFLSHAHLDHSGYLPWFAGHRRAPIYTTPVSSPIADLLARDSLKICKAEGYPYPYTMEDVEAMNAAFEHIHHGETFDAGRGVEMRFHSAGHIPGSTMFEVRDPQAGKTTLFTGDINLVETRLQKPAKPVPCDTLIIEATYSGRNHPDRKQTEEAFLDAVDGIVSQGGRVLVPSFATGRTQEILLLLAKAGYEVWLDGMGKTVTQIMLAESRYLKSPRDLNEAFQRTHLVKSRHMRERALQGDVIVATSGMLEGGPSVHYVEQMHKDPKSAVFFTGFQVPGSGGRNLLETGTLNVAGVTEKVACEVRRFDFSAHAGHDEIVAFARACRAQDIVLFHSDNRGPLAEALGEFAKVHLPVTGESVILP
ncbi:MAG TPA: MBL fold metallo-hydrolase [Candidatus Thermoplasmatota archaeon]|nr:MBL fold metallo-hydrolase [Candidatus Thermoplasmatota archaeon]